MPLVPTLILEPALVWTAGQAMQVQLVPLTLPPPRQVSDFNLWTLTIRSDPSWPRSGQLLANKPNADPINENWPVAVTSVGALDADNIPTFSFTVPSAAGVERYAVDVWGGLVAGGEVQLYQSRWLTVAARVK